MPRVRAGSLLIEASLIDIGSLLCLLRSVPPHVRAGFLTRPSRAYVEEGGVVAQVAASQFSLIVEGELGSACGANPLRLVRDAWLDVAWVAPGPLLEVVSLLDSCLREGKCGEANYGGMARVEVGLLNEPCSRVAVAGFFVAPFFFVDREAAAPNPRAGSTLISLPGNTPLLKVEGLGRPWAIKLAVPAGCGGQSARTLLFGLLDALLFAVESA